MSEGKILQQRRSKVSVSVIAVIVYIAAKLIWGVLRWHFHKCER